MNDCPSSSSPPTRSDRNCIIFALVFPALLTFVYFSLLANAPTVLQNSVYSVLKITQFSIPFVWVRFVQGRKLSLRANPFRGQLPGIVFGIPRPSGDVVFVQVLATTYRENGSGPGTDPQ